MSESIKQAKQRNYDGTVARIAGNLLSGETTNWYYVETRDKHVAAAVATARAIVAETKRTEPQPEPAELTR